MSWRDIVPDDRQKFELFLAEFQSEEDTDTSTNSGKIFLTLLALGELLRDFEREINKSTNFRENSKQYDGFNNKFAKEVYSGLVEDFSLYGLEKLDLGLGTLYYMFDMFKASFEVKGTLDLLKELSYRRSFIKVMRELWLQGFFEMSEEKHNLAITDPMRRNANCKHFVDVCNHLITLQETDRTFKKLPFEWKISIALNSVDEVPIKKPQFSYKEAELSIVR